MRTYSPNPWLNLAIYYNQPKYKLTPALWDNIKKSINASKQGCWMWTGDVTSWGYPILNNKSPHHALYVEYNGPIPDDHVIIATKCRRKLCVSPYHTEPVSRSDVYKVYMKNERAIMAQNNKCTKGHDLDEVNRLVLPSGKRRCRTCMRKNNATYRAKRKEKHGAT